MDSRPAHASHRHSRLCTLAALVLVTTGPHASRPSLQSVRLVVENGATSVSIVADGALPAPKVGVLTDPPRIYLDFPDVATATAGARASEGALVRGVRVAVNQPQPLVTRVVIDLARPAPHRIETGLRDSGQILILVGVPADPVAAPTPRPTAPSPAEPPKTTDAGRAPATPPAAPAPAPPALPPPPQPLPFRPSLRTVRLIDVGDGSTSVLLSADGALPSPEVGVLADPPSVCLDFPGVQAETEGVRVNEPRLVSAVRVAANPSQPLTTRVLIELARPAPHRIDADLRNSGHLTIVVGVPLAVAAARTPTPEPAARAARSPAFASGAEATAVRAPAKDVAQYLQRTLHVLERLERLRPLLASLDALAALPNEQLKAAADEFRSTRQALAAIVPPRTLAATHELFVEVCVLGAAAAAARVTPNVADESTRAWNAAAAAAGAIMLLDRARAEVGLGESLASTPGRGPDDPAT
jgi:hypothetical protein